MIKRDKSIIITLSLVVATVLSGVALVNGRVSADDTTSAVSNASVTVPVSCIMSSTIDTAHNATLSPGTYSGASGSQYENGIGKTTLTTYCNDNNGFSIYAIGFTGDSYDGENHTKLVGTTASGNATIATKVYESSDTQSNWSMKVTKVENPSGGDPITYNPQNMSITNSFNSWHVIPDTYTKVAEYHATVDSSTTDTALGAKVETTYASYIAPTQAADTYTGKVKYTMVHPYDNVPADGPQSSTPGCITYHRGANDVVGAMGCQSATDGASLDLLASNFSRTGYGFAGWSDSFDYATNPNAKFYGPSETITVPTGTTANGLSLYAVWVKSQGSIQDQSKVASVCNSLTTAPTDGTANLTSVSALTDQRDNNTYAIARLADGKCWMIENLRLDNSAEHNSDGALAQGYGTSATYGNFSGLANAESENFSNSTTANSVYYRGTQSGDATVNIGTSNYSGYRMPRYNNLNTTNRAANPTSNTFTDDNTTGGMYSYGNYYTWHATIANTTYYNSPVATDADGKTSETVNTSLCPTGWRLPYGRDTGNGTTIGGFYNLNYKINNDSNVTDSTASLKLRSFPNNFLYSGNFDASSADNRGSRGYYWSSTAVDNYRSYHLLLFSSLVYPGTNYDNKYLGRSIRCTVGS